MSRQDVINGLLVRSAQRLKMLEQHKMMMGPGTPPEIQLEIDDLKSQVANLQAESNELERVGFEEPPKEIEGLYFSTKRVLDNFRRTTDDLLSEPDYISGEARLKAISILDQAKQNLLNLEKEWNALDVQSETAETVLEGLLLKIPVAQSNLETLLKRYNYRRRFNILEQQVTDQYIGLTEIQLQEKLHPLITAEQEAIRALEQRDKLRQVEPDSFEAHLQAEEQRLHQKLITTHRRNLRLYQEMLNGERPYIPVHILNELINLEEELNNIDKELVFRGS